jgi:hypothetical protein
MSQLARSASQPGMQTPPVHVLLVVPAGVSQTRPHVPQFASSVCRSTQIPPQGNRLPGHWHTLFWQVLPPVQVIPQSPQLLLSVAVFTHSSSQSSSAPLQPHMPLMHGRPPVHGELQPPQCMALFVTLISQPFGPMPSQFRWVEAHVGVQVPLTHSLPALVTPVGWHTVPQAPQSPSSERRSDSQLSGFASQSSKFGRHSSISQALLTHCPVAFTGAAAKSASQSRSQAPQFALSAVVFVSQPSATPPEQSSQPALHAMRHSPSTHDAVPFVVGQTRPHAPQFMGSSLVFVSQPFA